MVSTASKDITGNFRENFIFANSFKRHICHVKNSEAEHNLPTAVNEGAQWLSGRALDSRPKGREFEPQQRHCVVSFSKNINPSLVLVQPKKTRPFITERLLMGRKESNQTNISKRQSKLAISRK